MNAGFFDFDALVERRNTGSIKWNKYADQDVIPMWVADMDFRSPPVIMQALHERVDHGVFGYGHVASPELVDTVLSWLDRSYGWQVNPDWLVWLPGLVCGLNVTCRALCEAGDGVLSATPVYYHLFKAPTNMGQQPITVPLAHEGDLWTFDFERLEQAITPNTKLFMLCNPHNPVGRIFARAELSELAALCEKHDLLICSDEIHCQLILDEDKPHIPIASLLSPAIAERTITLMAPSKTYNIPGLGCAFAVIPNADIRERFNIAKTGIVPHLNVLGYAATLAAYRDADDWLAALLDYLRANRDLLISAIEDMPGLSISPIEATYLGWIDAREAELDNPAAFFEQAGVGLSPGENYGGDGFVRLNFGCPRTRLEQGLDRMRRALAKR